MALRTFHAEGKLEWRAAGKMVVPATVGSVVGVLAAEMLPNRDMGLIITAAVLIAFLLLFTKLKEALAKDHALPPQVTALGLFALAGVGIWLGFIVLDGATYLLLVLILLFRFDLPHANALKVLLLVTTTLVPIILFTQHGDIWWKEGLLLSAGSILGGYLGAKLSTHPQARLGFPHPRRRHPARAHPSRRALLQALRLSAALRCRTDRAILPRAETSRRFRCAA